MIEDKGQDKGQDRTGQDKTIANNNMILLTVILKLHKAFPGGLPPPRPPARAGGRGFWGTHFGSFFVVVFYDCLIFVCGFQASGGSSCFFS